MMDTYFQRLEEIVKNHEEEIQHLNNERETLQRQQHNMPFNEFNSEYQKLILYLENENRSLNEAKNTLESYRFNYDKANSLINDLRNLRSESAKARDNQDKDEINEEISAKENELKRALAILPLELADYLRNSILEKQENNIKREETSNNLEESSDNSILSSLEEVKPAKQEQPSTSLNLLPEAEADYQKISADIEKIKQAQIENDKILQEAISRLKEILKEEQEKYEKEGPFGNETLKSLQEYYMGLKISENEIFIEAKRNQARLARKLKQLQKKQAQIIEINQTAIAFNISYAESKELYKSLNNRKMIAKILEQKGLGDIIHKSSRNKSEKERLKNALEEIKTEIVNYHNDKNTDIKCTINILYGTDEKVTSKNEAREMKLPQETYLAISDNAKKLPAVIRKPDLSNKVNEQQLLSMEDSEPIPKLPDFRQNELLIVDKNNENFQENSKENEEIKLPKKNIEPEEDDKRQDEDSQKEEDKDSSEKEKPVLKRGLREIIGDLRKDLYIGKKDGQRYRHSNLKVSHIFKEELHSGNVLYNIVHVVPTVVKAGTQFLEKLSAKIMLGKDAKEMMHTLEDRVNKLSYQDLETIFKEYRGNRINQEKYPQALNMVIEQKMSEYILGRVTVINENIEQNYANVFYASNLLKSIDENLRKGKLSNEEKLSRLEERKKILEQAAESIKYIRNAKIEADNLLSGGLHGLSEDMKATASKLNYVGMRFAKNHDLDQDLEDALMNCEIRENSAIYEENNEELLKAFIDSEKLLSQNTQISNSLLGHRSTGKKYYSPLAEQLDYRNDPFLRDLFTSIAVTSAAVNVANTVHTTTQQNLFATEDKILDKVHQAGEQITSKRGAMYEGMKAQANQDILTSSGSIERASLDSNGWAIATDAYHTADKAGHEFFTNFNNSVQERFANVTQSYSSGVLNKADVLQELSQIATDSHATLVSVADKCLEILKPYAQNNPQFDLGAVQDTMQYIVNHPNAIANMNQAMVDIQNIGQDLITLSEEQMTTISNLPDSLGATFLSAASACALAGNVANSMGATKKKYGNEVTDMVNEYINGENQEEENQIHR